MIKYIFICVFVLVNDPTYQNRLINVMCKDSKIVLRADDPKQCIKEKRC